MKEDYTLKNDTDRQKYLNDLERLRRIRENEQYNSKNKSVSEYIEDYYYDADDQSLPPQIDDGYGDYEEFLMERNQKASFRTNTQEDAFLFDYRRKSVNGVSERNIREQSIRVSKENSTPYRNKKEDYLQTKNGANVSVKRPYPMQTGLRLPELNGDLEQKRLAIQQAEKEALRRRELEEAAILEQQRRDAELEQKRRAARIGAGRSSQRGAGAQKSSLPQNRSGVHKTTASQRETASQRTSAMQRDPAAQRASAAQRELQAQRVSGTQRDPAAQRASVSQKGMMAKKTPSLQTGAGISKSPAIKKGIAKKSNDRIRASMANNAVSSPTIAKSNNHPPKNNTSKREKDKTPVPFGVRLKKFFGNVIKIIVVSFLFFCGFLAYSFYTKQQGYYTIAIFGVDSRDGNVGKDALADVNMIANINRETGAIQLVSVYRDMITEIDGNGNYHKLNEAYFKGGASRAVAALERNLDLDIEGYATFNWKAVVDGINILGGIDLEITEAEFKYINSFITETVEGTGVGSHHLKQPGMNHLDGVQAVAYARLRLMDTDFNRTERQRKVVKLAMEKAKKADFATLNNIMVSILPQIATNLSLDDLIPFAKDMKKYYLAESAGFPFELVTMNIGKRDYVVPVTLKSNVIKLHSFLYGESGTVSYTPSAKLKEISKYIISVSGHGEDKEDIEIKVDKGGEGGIGSKGGGTSSTRAVETSKSETSAQETTQATTEAQVETTEAETTTELSEETIAPIESPTLAPETTAMPPDQGDAGVTDDNRLTQAPDHDALSDDAQNGPGVNP